MLKRCLQLVQLFAHRQKGSTFRKMHGAINLCKFCNQFPQNKKQKNIVSNLSSSSRNGAEKRRTNKKGQKTNKTFRSSKLGCL